MAHYRKPLAAAVALNGAIFVVEAVAGFQAHSLSLVMDSIHNLSDQMALVFLYLAFILPQGVSRNLLRSANLFNSAGLVAISGLLLWQAIERALVPCLFRALSPLSLVSAQPWRIGAWLSSFGVRDATMRQFGSPTSTTWGTCMSPLPQ